jgi:tetratricopeptide (TPR) repeat protein
MSPSSPTDLLGEGRTHQLGGRLGDAAECFALAVDVAAASGDHAAIAEGWRRLGIVHHLRGETSTGLHYCERSRDAAIASQHPLLAAEATMALANMACEQGRMNEARDLYHSALTLSEGDATLAARIEQNLGTVESVQGNLDEALKHFRRALEACEATHDVIGRAKAHHNIGMVCADQKDWRNAEVAYEHAAALARKGGDYHLSGLCHLNRAEIDLAHERYDAVRSQAEAALTIFDHLGARVDMAAAFRMIGTALRHLKRPTLAESRLRSALEIASNSGVPLTEAETCRDMAMLCAETGRRDEAVGYIDRAGKLFRELGAAIDVADVMLRRTMLLAA